MSEQSFEMIAKTFQGLEEVLAQELTALGANEIEIGRRMVSFSGDKEMMYKANFCLRTAIRILKPIKHFTAKDADEVYEQIKAIRWEDYLDTDKTFAFDGEFTTERLGTLDTEMIREFFYAVSYSAGMNLHIKVLSPGNNHHMAEAMFKAFARALDEAVSHDPRVKGILSTKGSL